MNDVFVKPKINIVAQPNNGMTVITIQDETFTLMEPLLEILQADPRLKYAGYKNTHCLINEIILKLKSVEDSQVTPKDCLEEALKKLLQKLTDIENLCGEKNE